MKALEKDRTRRYETANGFAMDIQRYLAREPVLAAPPSTRYRLRKFARRHGQDCPWRWLLCVEEPDEIRLCMTNCLVRLTK
jgi:hypothetical protein